MDIGICGFGVVGQALYSYFKNNSRHISCIYDKYKEIGNLDYMIRRCEIIFTCLPTEDDGSGQDFSAFNEFLDRLIDKEYDGIVVIKSTVLYSNIKPYLDKLRIVMNPEFLNQNNSFEDIESKKVAILGGDLHNSQKISKIYKHIDPFVEVEYCSHKEAIDIKYFHNMYHAYKVLFWNYVNEQIGDHRKISRLYKKITGNTFELDNVASDGKMGFGGACFPKDLNSYHFENPHELTQFMLEFNARLRGK